MKGVGIPKGMTSGSYPPCSRTDIRLWTPETVSRQRSYCVRAVFEFLGLWR